MELRNSAKITRRQFVKGCLSGAAGMTLAPFVLDLSRSSAHAAARQRGGPGFAEPHEAMYYKVMDSGAIRCELCPRHCVLHEGMRGFCRAREPKGGKLYSFVYGNPTAVHVDPIEKKPFYHLLPGTSSFSIATAGCNYRCKYCQNWEISQFKPEETVNQDLPPQSVVDGALRYKCRTIAYTYTDPAIFYEYMRDTSLLAKARGILNVSRTNGSLNPEPIKEMAGFLDATNIDLKGFDQAFYSSVPEGYLKPVLDNIIYLKKRKVHIELTNLIVPTLNDDMTTIRKMCKWIHDEAGKEVPVHFSRFHPTYKLRNLPPTPVATLERARSVAFEEGLEFVYIGNVPGHEANNTYCPNDKKLLIQRAGYRTLENNIEKGKCKFCGYGIYGVWDKA
ncbi:MAG: AmmeMemoRadiSam system radical SAM enzyme [Candidatus Omnitrophota bacterium]